MGDLSEPQIGLSLGTRALAIEACCKDNDKWIRKQSGRRKQNRRSLRVVLLRLKGNQISPLSVVCPVKHMPGKLKEDYF